jgi:SAM-dependent methyltransferase
MNHNDYLFSFSDNEFRFLRRFDEMYRNCEDPHGQSKAIHRIDYQIVSSVLDRALLSLPATGRPPWILDVGCGLGYFTARMHKLFPAAEVSGCDISANAIEKARVLAPECKFFPLDLRDGTAVPPPSYDVIVALHMLCYFTDAEIDGVVDNLHRMVHPGGFVLVGHHLPKQMNFGRFIQRMDDARTLFERRGFALRVALDITNELDRNHAGDAVGRSIYFLAQTVQRT